MSEIITDARGRKITVEALDVMRQVTLLRAMQDDSKIDRLLLLCETACMVKQIDDTPIPQPTSRNGIDALIRRLGDDGVAAVMVYRAKSVREVMERAERAAEEEGKKPDPLEQSASS